MIDQPDINPPVPFRLPALDSESIALGTRTAHLILHGCGHLWPYALNPWRNYEGRELDSLQMLPCPACRRSLGPVARSRFPDAEWTEEFILDAAVKHLLCWTDLEEARRRHVTYGNPGDRCDCCPRSLVQARMFVDGIHREHGLAAFMCPTCFLRLGRGLGDGLGQLYALEDSGSWLQVAGFSAAGPEQTLEDIFDIFCV